MLDQRRGCRWAMALGVALSMGAGTARAQEGGLVAAAADTMEREEAARLLALKEARAEAILVREEGRGRPLDAAFRAEMKARLVSVPTDELEAVEKRGQGLLPAPEVLGDEIAELVYIRTEPCRIIDTRVAGGPIPAGGRRDFYVAGGVGFETQGGTPGGCEVPNGSTFAAAINFVAVNPAGAGNLRAWAYGGTVPNASIINYAAVGLNIANAVIVPICSGCVRDLTVQADVSGTQLVADVVGYFIRHRKSFAMSTIQSAAAAIPPIACTNAGGNSISVFTSVAGQFVVRGSANLRIQHVNGTAEDLWTAIGATPTDCPGTDFGRSVIVTRIPAAFPTFNSASGGTFSFQVSPLRIFSVAPGLHTYYLNFLQLGGAGDDSVLYGSLEATFHPQ